METLMTPKEYLKDDVIKAFLSIQANILINSYTNENVVFGHIKPNDKVPIRQYLDELGFCNIEKFLGDLFLDGRNIEKGYVLERDSDKRCFELFRDKAECIFNDIPTDKSYGDDDEDIFHYKYGLYDYIKSIYPLYKEIINTQVKPDLYEAVPDILDEEKQRTYYFKATRFVKAIKLKRLKQGGCVDRYVKDLKFMSPFIRRLLVKRKGRFILKNSNTDSLNYKLALLSCFRYMNEYNAKLFELKALRWEEIKKTTAAN